MKQTPRNPVLERPLTAMGIDVQEKRAPSKPATKRYQLEENNLTSISHTRPSNEKQQQVVLKSHIDTDLDC